MVKLRLKLFHQTQFRKLSLTSTNSKQSLPVFLIRAKEYKKSKIFFWHFCTDFLRSLTFFLPPKIGVFFPLKTVDSCSSCGSRHRIQTYDLFFFEEQHKIEENDASVNVMTSFLDKAKYRAENFCSTDQERLKSCGIFTLSSESLHYF